MADFQGAAEALCDVIRSHQAAGQAAMSDDLAIECYSAAAKLVPEPPDTDDEDEQA